MRWYREKTYYVLESLWREHSIQIGNSQCIKKTFISIQVLWKVFKFRRAFSWDLDSYLSWTLHYALCKMLNFTDFSSESLIILWKKNQNHSLCYRRWNFIKLEHSYRHRWFKEDNEQLIPLQLGERISMASAGLLKITKVIIVGSKNSYILSLYPVWWTTN